MRNLGLFVLGILCGALAVYFLMHRESVVTSPPRVTAPSGVISPEQIKTLDRAYNERYRIINDSLFKNSKTGDNRSAWYNIEDLEGYLAYAKQQASNEGYILDGLRLYLGAHPDTSEGKGLTTVLLVPTGYKNVSEGSMLLFQDGSHDIEGADGLDFAGHGKPPRANYPQ
ncbi:hypothetical protein [Winogradskyella arenosi]|uniref:Uncharacterized protein n=1 Tax=Winogradskyella arenosi TaxID=533325 RepID=A0A368ZJF8_9FLAO|nr:hypothetical protein [Winogradskyella arenosi]RCW92767.1 hypothetical protein DFQ08_102803 [Winogradskyella arenosi]